MKKNLLTLFVCSLLVFFSMQASIRSNQVMHIVVFKYKSTAPVHEVAEVTKAFTSLKEKIPGIISFQYGTNNSEENLNKGFTHAYVITFKDASARDAYLTPTCRTLSTGDL
jgi:hypothetical protein